MIKNFIVKLFLLFKQIFDFHGRINRAKYIFIWLLLNLLTLPVTLLLFSKHNYMLSVSLIFLLYCTKIFLNILLYFNYFKRLQDININGLWAILLFALLFAEHFPPLFLLFRIASRSLPIILMFPKGTTGNNRFGPDPLKKEE